MTTSAPSVSECTCDAPSVVELERGRFSLEFESTELERGRPGLGVPKIKMD